MSSLAFDVGILFNTGAPAEKSATLTVGEDVSTITVLFYNEGEFVELAGVEFETTSPMAFAETADVSAAAQEDTLVISGTTYYIREQKEVFSGLTQIWLSIE